MGSRDERYREILKQAGSGTREGHLKERVQICQQRFMQAHSEAEGQSRLVKVHQAAAQEKTENPAEAASREALYRQAEEVERRAWLMVEHQADELKLAEKQLEDLQGAGLPEKP